MAERGAKERADERAHDADEPRFDEHDANELIAR